MSNPINSHNIIIKPIFSEKSLKDNVFNRYHFKVDSRANKIQIKQAVQELFDVDVVKVRTMIIKSRQEMSRRTGKPKIIKGYKKASVEIKPKQKIDLFSNLK